MSGAVAASARRGLSPAGKRIIWVGVALAVLALIVFGTKIVPDGDPLTTKKAEFDATTFGSENFAAVQKGVVDQAVDAETLAQAIAADPAAAAKKYATESSGGPVYSVKLTGVVGAGQSGAYDLAVEGIPAEQRIRVQTGPAINGTELRDATGEIVFGQFKNQIDFQDAAAALNDEMKKTVLSNVDAANLTGKTLTVTGAFTLINPNAWLITPVKVDVR